MKLFIIRHGQSKGNIKPGFISGRSDPDGLTEKGKIQIIRTAYELRKENIDTILVSPVVRTQETAGIIHNYFPHAKIETVEWLNELHHGMFEGFYWWEIIHKIPPMWHLRRGDFTSAYPRGGESMRMLAKRLWIGLENFNKTKDTKKTYLLVSHQAVLTTLRYLLEFGDPAKMHTKSKQKKFIDFLHNLRVENGAYFEINLMPKSKTTFRQSKEFKHIDESPEAVGFYAKGLFLDPKISAEKIPTVSSNSDFLLQSSKKYLLKLIKSKDLQVTKRQIELYKYLNKKKVRVSTVVAHDPSNIFFCKEIVIQDYVSGNDQNHCLDKHTNKVNTVFSDLYKEIEKIHKLPVQEVKSFWVPPSEDQFQKWETFMVYNINYTIYMMDSLGLDEKVKFKLKNSLLRLKTYVLSKNYHLVPIHGDLSSENIIIDHNKTCRLVRIVDFEWARIGDRLWDLAYYWGWLERSDAEIAKRWHDLLSKKLDTESLMILDLFRNLFHAWTVRDIGEYKDDLIRAKRGKKSREILNVQAIS